MTGAAQGRAEACRRKNGTRSHAALSGVRCANALHHLEAVKLDPQVQHASASVGIITKSQVQSVHLARVLRPGQVQAGPPEPRWRLGGVEDLAGLAGELMPRPTAQQ